MVAKISVYFCYIPLCLMTAAFLMNICASSGKRMKYISAALILISLLPSAVHVWDLYAEQQSRGDRIEKTSYRYEDFGNWLRSRTYPYFSLMLPTDMPLDISTSDLNWIPKAETLSAEERERAGPQRKDTSGDG